MELEITFHVDWNYIINSANSSIDNIHTIFGDFLIGRLTPHSPYLFIQFTLNEIFKIHNLESTQ